MRYKSQDEIDQENRKAEYADFKRWQKIVADAKGWLDGDVRLTKSLINVERANQRAVIATVPFNMHIVKVPYRVGIQDNTWDRNAVHYQVKIWARDERSSYVFQYSQGSGIKQFPTIREILFSFIQDAMLGSQAFGEYCDSMGADSDSRKAYQVYQTCVESFDWFVKNRFYHNQITKIAGILQEAENRGDINDRTEYMEPPTENEGEEIPF